MPHVIPPQGLQLDRPADCRKLAEFYREALMRDTIPFWLEHGLDRARGGILTCLNRDGAVVDTDKGIWQQGRFAWLMGHLYNTVEQRPEWLAACESTIRFLERHGSDQDGRMWFHVTRDGRPIRRRRYAFSEAFAAIAFGEYARATSSERHREAAISAFRAFLDVQTRPGRMTAKFTGTRPLKGLGTPMIALATAQELRASVGYAEADATIDACIAEIERDFVKPELECVLENVGPAGEMY
ncbi:MAG TPA: AGE family epimerase/isomerase, partial [Pararhizobium sp.]|nr:AGE family epimerase/isomerase [Pararhizobium sp.]